MSEILNNNNSTMEFVNHKTVIAEGVIMEGNLTTSGDVEICGYFKGNIKTEGNVFINSKVEADISANNLKIYSNELKGNAIITNNVTLTNDSTIKGLIIAKNVECSGKVYGNMTITSDAFFDKTAHVEGNISAKNISLEHGTFFDGKIKIIK